jgi:Mn-dependent DtxR family transcriptional regulator
MIKKYVLKKTDYTNYKLKIKGETNMDTVVERYCTVEESLVESLKQMKAMRGEKLPVKIWKAFKKELE